MNSGAEISGSVPRGLPAEVDDGGGAWGSIRNSVMREAMSRFQPSTSTSSMILKGEANAGWLIYHHAHGHQDCATTMSMMRKG